MAGELATAYVRLRPNAAGFQKEAEAQVRGALGGISKTVALAIGATGVFELTKNIAEAASEHQSAVALTERTVKNAGAAWVVYGKTVEEELDKQARATGISFQDLYQGFIRLETQFKNTPAALKALTEAEDVARARHLGLAQAATALARAQGGSAQSLSRLGIIVPKVTAAQDALKAKLVEVSHVETAAAEARAKHYQGTIHLTAAELELAKLTPVQLKNYAEQLKGQQAQAVAADKTASATRALSEVQARYGGSAAAYAKTAAGASAQFHVSLEEAEASIGKQLLPLLSQAARAAAGYADAIGKSKGVASGVKTAALDIAGAVEAVVHAVQAAAPVIRLVQSTIDAVGVEPLLAAAAAYKAITLAVSAAAVAQARYTALKVRGGGPAAVAGAEGTGATGASSAALAANTDAIAANTAALSEQAAALRLAAAGYDEEVPALAADTAALEADTVAKTENAAASGGLALAGRGLLSVMTSPTGLIVGAALLAGGLYYLSTRSSEAELATKRLSSAYSDLAAAQRDSSDASREVKDSGLALSSARLADRDATAALAAARRQLNHDVEAGVPASKQASDADAVAHAEDTWRQANNNLIQSEQRKHDAIKKAEDDAVAVKKKYDDLIKTQLDLARQAVNPLDRVAAARSGSDSERRTADLKTQADAAAELAARFRDVARTNKDISDAQRFNLRLTADYLDATKKIPPTKTLKLELNDASFYATLRKDLGVLKGAGQAFVDIFTGEGNAGSRGGASIAATVKKKGGELGATAATSYTQSFVQHIDAGAITTALTDAIAQAQSQLTSEASSFSTSIATTLDAQLAKTTLPLTKEIAALQARITASQAASSARDTAQAVADAQKKLDDLNRIYGPGAHTADQNQQIAQAGVALADAQAAVANAGRQATITADQAKIDSATKVETAQKAAAARRLADLADELDHGLISQRQYLKGLNDLLRHQGVNYKATGRLLGQAAADGFRDGFASLVAQAGKLGEVGQAGLKSAARGTTPIDPRKAEASAIQTFLDQVAQSGGKFDVTGKLPKGLSLPGLISQAAAQRATDEYRTKSGAKQDKSLQYQGATRDHTALIVDELRKLNAKDAKVVVHVDGKKATAKTARATRS